MNKEISIIRHAHSKEFDSYDYYLEELIASVNSLESKITGGCETNKECIVAIADLILQKEFSVFAQAGYGKTHLACSLAKNMVKRELPVILFTGGMFRKNDSFEQLIRHKLDLSDDLSYNDVLDTLDFVAETCNCKLPMIIDGLNESAPNECRWREDLPILRRKINEHKNLILITTCREKREYLEVIYGTSNYQDIDNHILLNGLSEGNLELTVKRYFAKYNITNASILNIGAFDNPLLLKIFCHTNQSKNNLVVNDRSLASCMKAYSDQLLVSISTKDGRLDKLTRHTLEQGLNNVSCIIWNSNNRTLNYYDQFVPLFKEDVVECFLKEGMCFTIENNQYKEQIQFTYDMVAGYHIAKYILSICLDANSFISFIQTNASKFFGEGRHTLAEDTIKCLFYLVPEKYGKDWVEIMPTDDVIKEALSNLDIMLSTESGRTALLGVLTSIDMSDDIEGYIINSLHERFVVQRCVDCISLFTEFFAKVSHKAFDLYWNSHLAKYGEMMHAYSIMHDRQIADRFSEADKLTYLILLCGITDKEFRQKFYWQAIDIAQIDKEMCLKVCRQLLYIKDPFVREIVISLITCIGLRSTDVDLVCECADVLGTFMENTHNTNIVLLDNLETLYSHAECMGCKKNDRAKLYANYGNEWTIGNADELNSYSVYGYDFDKYNIRPLYMPPYDKPSQFKSEEIYGMLA